METVDSTEQWRSLFENWPEVIPKNATIVTRQGESIPFSDFMMSGGLLLLERAGPDAAGMRKIIVSYDAVAMIKLGSTGALSGFQCMGFQASF